MEMNVRQKTAIHIHPHDPRWNKPRVAGQFVAMGRTGNRASHFVCSVCPKLGGDRNTTFDMR